MNSREKSFSNKIFDLNDSYSRFQVYLLTPYLHHESKTACRNIIKLDISSADLVMIDVMISNSGHCCLLFRSDRQNDLLVFQYCNFIIRPYSFSNTISNVTSETNENKNLVCKNIFCLFSAYLKH